ncbi:MAG: hypothetical protein U0470_00340 [Anaerolineae bacterium]
MADVTPPGPPADTAPDVPAPREAGDPWPRKGDPPPRWTDPPAETRRPKPVGPWAALGLVIVTFGGTLAALWVAAMTPTLALRLVSDVGFEVPTDLGVFGFWVSVLLVIATAAVIAWWCNRPEREPYRFLLNFGFGCAVAPFAIAAVLFGLCLALLASGPIW